eukprot:14146219-Ditylum_brightwellii.AAC.1
MGNSLQNILLQLAMTNETNQEDQVKDAHFLVKEDSLFQQRHLLEAYLQHEIAKERANMGRECELEQEIPGATQNLFK